MKITRFQIKALRHVLGGSDPRDTTKPPYTQLALARYMGIHVTTIRGWEAGRKILKKQKYKSILGAKIKAHAKAVSHFASIVEAQARGEVPMPPQWHRSTPRPNLGSKAEKFRRAHKDLSMAAEEYAKSWAEHHDKDPLETLTINVSSGVVDMSQKA